MNEWLDELGLKPRNGAYRAEKREFIGLTYWLVQTERERNWEEWRAWQKAGPFTLLQEWTRTKPFLHFSWPPCIIISMCLIPAVSISVKTLAYKNAFQWDAYRPLVDCIPACTTQGVSTRGVSARGGLPGGWGHWGRHPPLWTDRHLWKT